VVPFGGDGAWPRLLEDRRRVRPRAAPDEFDEERALVAESSVDGLRGNVGLGSDRVYSCSLEPALAEDAFSSRQHPFPRLFSLLPSPCRTVRPLDILAHL
jgi:hypothetical protein